MGRIHRLILCAALLAATCGVLVPSARAEVSFGYRSDDRGRVGVSYFYSNLSPYGEWFRDSQYGWCWTPYDMPADWRPYSYGHWEYSDYGWVWVSDEPWGWAPYHYGRWFFDDQYGWAWVPGTTWAPAWVAWSYSDDCVGWAPLPPAANWDVSFGLSFSNARSIPASEWCFVPTSRAFDRDLRGERFSIARNVTLLQRSRDATRIESRAGHPFNPGPDVARIERVSGRRIDRVRIADADSPRGTGGRAGNDVRFFRPHVERGAASAPPQVSERRPMPEQVYRQRHDEGQRRLEGQLRDERQQMQREQSQDLRRGPGAGNGDQMRRQQQMEQRTFEQHAQQQRQVFEQRMQKRVIPPEQRGGPPEQRGGPPEQRGRQTPPQQRQQPPQQQQQDRGRGHGHGRDHGGDQ
jgi:hypothetical protein